MRHFNRLLLLVWGLCWTSCTNSPGENNTDEGLKKPKIATVEEANKDIPKEVSRFAVGASVESMTAIALSRLALTRATGAGVREFAESALASHTHLKKELAYLAQQRNITLPIVMDKEHQEPYDKLKELKDHTQFDSGYINLMLTNLDMNIELHEDASKHIQDPDLRAFIQKSLSLIRRQEEEARMLR